MTRGLYAETLCFTVLIPVFGPHRVMDDSIMDGTSVAGRRNDVFLSFHGREVLCDRYTVRELACSLKTDGVLQEHWVNTDRIGTLEIFIDEPGITTSVKGRRKMLDGMLQTRGGGVVVILASEGYFKSNWCMTELLCAIELSASSKQHERVRLCCIALGISVEDIRAKTESVLLAKQMSLPPNFIIHTVHSEDLHRTNISNVTRGIADWIVSCATGLIAGATVDDCRDMLVEEILRELESSATGLIAIFGLPGKRPLVELTDLGYRQSQFLISGLRKFLSENPESATIRVCRKKLQAFEAKWSPMDWDGERTNLEKLRVTVDTGADNYMAPASADSDMILDDCIYVDFSRASMEENRYWNKNVISKSDHINRLLAQLVQYGKVRFGRPFLTVQGVPKSSGQEQPVARLTCKIDLREDLAQPEVDNIRDIWENLVAMLKNCGATDKEVEGIMAGSSWER